MASDLISRKELKKFTTVFAEDYGVKVAEMFRDIVNQQPTVDAVEVVHGEWIYGNWDENHHWVSGSKKVRCSKCWRAFDSDNLNVWNWCPHCGADMRGVDNE